MPSNEWDPSAFAALIREMGTKNQSAYGDVDGETTIGIPTQAVRGRTGYAGKTFSGKFDLESGIIRIDCAEDPSFWLEIDIHKIPALSSAPGGHEASAAHDEFVRTANPDGREP